MSGLKLGLQLGYWGAAPPPDAGELVVEAERLGYDSVWTAEAYGSDALTPLAWWGSRTTGCPPGHGLVPALRPHPHGHGHGGHHARPPLRWSLRAGAGRLGPASGGGLVRPTLPEAAGANPRVRLDRAQGDCPRIPGHQRGASTTRCPIRVGPAWAKPLKSIVHPLRPDIPIVLGAEGPKTWLWRPKSPTAGSPLSFRPLLMGEFSKSLAEGFARPEARRSAEDFEVIASCPVVVDVDIERAADTVRPLFALYIGGMGAPRDELPFRRFRTLGFEDVARKVQELYLAGHKAQAVAAVPTTMVEKVALVGPLEKIRDDVAAWQRVHSHVPGRLAAAAQSADGASTLTTIRAMAEVVLVSTPRAHSLLSGGLDGGFVHGDV